LVGGSGGRATGAVGHGRPDLAQVPCAPRSRTAARRPLTTRSRGGTPTAYQWRHRLRQPLAACGCFLFGGLPVVGAPHSMGNDAGAWQDRARAAGGRDARSASIPSGVLRLIFGCSEGFLPPPSTETRACPKAAEVLQRGAQQTESFGLGYHSYDRAIVGPDYRDVDPKRRNASIA